MTLDHLLEVAVFYAAPPLAFSLGWYWLTPVAAHVAETAEVMLQQRADRSRAERAASPPASEKT